MRGSRREQRRRKDKTHQHPLCHLPGHPLRLGRVQGRVQDDGGRRAGPPAEVLAGGAAVAAVRGLDVGVLAAAGGQVETRRQEDLLHGPAAHVGHGDVLGARQAVGHAEAEDVEQAREPDVREAALLGQGAEGAAVVVDVFFRDSQEICCFWLVSVFSLSLSLFFSFFSFSPRPPPPTQMNIYHYTQARPRPRPRRPRTGRPSAAPRTAC